MQKSCVATKDRKETGHLHPLCGFCTAIRPNRSISQRSFRPSPLTPRPSALVAASPRCAPLRLIPQLAPEPLEAEPTSAWLPCAKTGASDLFCSICIPVPKPVREANGCILEPFKPETQEKALYLVVAQGPMALQVVGRGLCHFPLPGLPPESTSRPTGENSGRQCGGGLGGVCCARPPFHRSSSSSAAAITRGCYV